MKTTNKIFVCSEKNSQLRMSLDVEVETDASN